jgi:uncharacterized membrane protein YedE/YeeE
MGWFTAARWSPYVVGAAIGALDCLAFVLSDRPLACSTAFARTSGMIEGAVRGARVAEKPYYRKFTPTIDWQWMLVVGIVIGAFVSAVASGEFRLVWVPGAWRSAFGPSRAVRMGAALAGGVALGLGARWAGGCTSGHGISGTMQLAVSSWVAAACFFAGGIATAMLLFRVIGA